MVVKTVCGLILKKFVSCDDCETQWENICPICKDKVTEKTKYRDENGKSLRKRVKIIKHQGKKIFILKPKEKGATPSKKKPLPIVQPTPITWDNFFIKTYGEFEVIKKIPDGFITVFESKGSRYLVSKNKKTVVRISDHWGFGIKHCNWYLKGYKRSHCSRWQKTYGSEKFIGIITIDNFKPSTL